MAKVPADRPTAGQLRDQLVAVIDDLGATASTAPLAGAALSGDGTDRATRTGGVAAAEAGAAFDGGATTSMPAGDAIDLETTSPPVVHQPGGLAAPVNGARGLDGGAILDHGPPAAIPAAAQPPIRYTYDEPRRLTPWLVGGGVAALAALLVVLLLTLSGGEETGGDGNDVAAIEGPTTSTGDGNEQFGNTDAEVNRGSLSPFDSSTTETTLTDDTITGAERRRRHPDLGPLPAHGPGFPCQPRDPGKRRRAGGIGDRSGARARTIGGAWCRDHDLRVGPRGARRSTCPTSSG